MSDPDEYLSAEEIGTILKVSTRTAQVHIKEGRCGRFLRLGKKHLVRRAEFERAMREQEVGPPPKPRLRRRAPPDVGGGLYRGRRRD